MIDTPKYILEKQFEIISAMPMNDRMQNLFDLTELSRSIIYNQLSKKFPSYSAVELKIELFKTFYRYDFDDKTLELIASNMRTFLISKHE